MSKKDRFLRFLAGIVGFVVIGVCSFSCTSIPEGLSPVENFDSQAYLGTWYEIARFDFKFERGLSKVTANYSLNPDGSIKVLNRGFNQEKGKWQEAKGKAKFRGADNVGALKVSFFKISVCNAATPLTLKQVKIARLVILTIPSLMICMLFISPSLTPC